MVTQSHAPDDQTRARRTNSLGPSAGLVRSRARMSELETSVVVRTWMLNKPGCVGQGIEKSDRRGWRLSRAVRNKMIIRFCDFIEICVNNYDF